MNKNLLSCFLIILLLVSCTKKEKTINKEENVIKVLPDKPEVKNNLEIDTSKLTKAFDNIYFGENNEMFKSHIKKDYSIANIFFRIDSEYRNAFLQNKIDEKYGLYQFRLIAYYSESYYSICLDDIQLVKSVIDRKYSRATKIFSPPAPKKYSPLQKAEIEIIKPQAYPPPDEGYINYLYKWNGENITIKAGIRTEYTSSIKNSENGENENPEFSKSYRLVLLFTYDKIEKLLIADEKKMDVEYNKKLKEQIKRDAVKF